LITSSKPLIAQNLCLFFHQTKFFFKSATIFFTSSAVREELNFNKESGIALFLKKD
jgi:hypothetical protein